MDASRLERAADRIYLILGVHREKMPNEAVEALQGVAAALAAPAPASAEAVGDAIPAMLLPLAHGLLRDANDAIDAGKGGMRPASPPKATVDAYRLRNVVAAVVAHLEAQRPGGAA